nr:immunoglobulin heavy chain junction region [Macaca mulatta]MOW48502.1 immunoglobulin heavy chain junction region [Macaca mulatta]MOW49433.1 immunoglobulin heavy chain junction region [Macaca mulatta]MOW49653.1 immunoglobulin heavy chain junction region [Macaca mulatta]MOW50852.1 immunoglobulin heavy chain junction region [Macaca mulatta]
CASGIGYSLSDYW